MKSSIKNASVSVDNEGEDVAGIGDIYGSCNISIRDSDLNIRILAATPVDIGSKSGTTQLINNKIYSLINEKEAIHEQEADE